ncbi:glycosyltransferase [Ruminococcus sp. OM08-13AT]|nr:glycosyltransferase [Ruminococcus sp. OM08-13AT]RGI56679.1 glycosyltransferase [Ruminococcus sp. OF05-2BH]
MDKSSLLDIIEPKANSTILIYDVHASESGALAILDDLYIQIKDYPDKSIKWVFAVSTPYYQNTDTITVLRYSWVKKNWGYRLFFDNITTRKILRKYCPDKVFSLQNKGISFFKKEQYVYLHLPFILTDHKFDIKKDGKKLWLYQNVLSKRIFASLRKVEKTIVQTGWMKEALVKKAGVKAERIVLDTPNISMNNIGVWKDTKESRRKFFYPATAFTYKNHMTMLQALNYAVKNGLRDYELFLTIKADESVYTHSLEEYAEKNHLNVIFNGPVPRSEVFDRYANSVLLFPSYVESFGLPLLEARMTGAPIIAADCPFSREILEGYEKSFFFPEMDYEIMGQAILEIGAKEDE